MGALTSRRTGRLVALGLVAALTLAACSGDDDAADDATDESTEDAGGADDEALAESEAALAEAEAALAAAEAEVEAATERAEEAEARATEAEAEVEEVTSTFEALVASETIRADTAEGQIQEFTDLFPIEVESTLEGIELDQEGVWNLTWQLAYSDNSLTGQIPATTQATFARSPEGLRVQVPGVLDAGLFSIDGSLYAITDSDALAPCADGTPRPARVTMTVYADDIRIDQDGTRSVTGLEGAITIDSLASGACDGLAFYGVQMTRAG